MLEGKQHPKPRQVKEYGMPEGGYFDGSKHAAGPHGIEYELLRRLSAEARL